MDLEALHKAAKSRYWEHKDLPDTRRLLEEGIVEARAQGRPDLEKPLQYDLASFCWTGWDESGISITPDDLAAGRHAADANLRLAKELARGDLPMANAWFMVGAYHLAFRRLEEAQAAFVEYGATARRAGVRDHELLAAGFAALCRASAQGSVDVSADVAAIEAEGEHGPMFAEQLRTAARVFGMP